jgi:hypothetical protein
MTHLYSEEEAEKAEMMAIETHHVGRDAFGNIMKKLIGEWQVERLRSAMRLPGDVRMS